MCIDDDFKSFIFDLYEKNEGEIFSFEYKENKYWLKKARATKSNLIHKMFYKISSFDVVFPVEEKSASDALEYETSKIERFRKLGINTPEIIYRDSRFFILKDAGKMVNSYIRKRDIKKEKMYYFIDAMLTELSKIHKANEFHGGAQSRNFTYKNGVVSAIDLEDSFDKNVDIKTLQFRDFFIFLLSLTKTRASFEIDYEYVIRKYIELCPFNNDFYQRLKILADKLSIFITLSQYSFIKKILGRDGNGFFKLFLALKNLEGK